MSKRLAKKVLLIGWDAADWKVIHPLMDAGYLPTLEGLVNEGIIGNLATLDPPMSPMLWTSIATGHTADKHGILGFTQPREDGQGIRPVLGTSRKVKAIWNILSQEGFRTHVVGWWPSHPAEPINGVSVSNFYHHPKLEREPWPLAPNSVYPERLAPILAELRVHPSELTGAHLFPFVPRAAEIDQENDRRLGVLAKIIADCSSVHAAATWIMEHEPWEFMAVYYDAIDHFGHAFMNFHPPQMAGVPDDLFEMYKDVVKGSYRFHDMMLARLLELAGEETTVLLISDHGFHSDHLRPKSIPREPAGPAIEHRNLGIFCMKGPHVLPDERLYGASLLDIAPTVLTLFGLPVGRDMRGKPLVQAFDVPVSPAYIESWELLEGEDGMYPPETRVDPWAEQEMLSQLVALGYIEPASEKEQKAVERTQRESKYYLARVYLSTARQQEAVPLLEALCAEWPDEQRFARYLAQAYLELGHLEDCRRVLTNCLRIEQEEKSTPGLDLLEGTLLLAEEEPQKALIFLLRAEKAKLQHPSLYQRIGDAYLKMGHSGLAEHAFYKALTIDPDSAIAYHGLAKVYLQQAEYEQAVEAALSAVGLIYHYPAAHYHLGEALMHLGAYKRAAEAFGVSVTQAPGIRQAHLRLAELYDHHLKQPKKAMEHLTFANHIIQA